MNAVTMWKKQQQNTTTYDYLKTKDKSQKSQNQRECTLISLCQAFIFGLYILMKGQLYEFFNHMTNLY